MSFFGFGKRTRHRKFDYVPRFYDPQKEELEERLRQYKTEPDAKSNDTELVKQRIRGGFKRNSRASSEAAKIANKKSNMRLLVILATLLLMTIYFLNKYLPKLVAVFE